MVLRGAGVVVIAVEVVVGVLATADRVAFVVGALIVVIAVQGRAHDATDRRIAVLDTVARIAVVFAILQDNPAAPGNRIEDLPSALVALECHDACKRIALRVAGAFAGYPGQRWVAAAGDRVADVLRAEVAIGAVDGLVLTFPCKRIAHVDSACISVITIDRIGRLAETGFQIARLDTVARVAIVAVFIRKASGAVGDQGEDAARQWIAIIFSAGVQVVAHKCLDARALAVHALVDSRTFVVVIARKGVVRVFATGGCIAPVIRAQIAIVA